MHGMVDLAQFAEGTGDAQEIQILKTGSWQHPTLGKISITHKDLAQFADNFNRNVRGVDLAVDIDHKPGDGAVGWFKKLRTEAGKLLATVDWTKEGSSLIKERKYRYFSPEFMFQWKDPATGTTHKNVLFGGALTNRPFLKGMEPVAFSESGMGAVWMADDEPYDPDHDGDNDANAKPSDNPDWMDDVKRGITPWSVCTPDQKQQLIAKGITHHVANRAHSAFMAAHPHLKMSEGVTNAHKSPPKGKPTNRDLYADPDNYKYPIDAKHIGAAVGYFNHPEEEEKGGYSDAEWAEIGRKIASAANRLIGPGHKFADGKIETPDDKGTAKMAEGYTGDYDPDGAPDEGTEPDDGTSKPHKPDDVDPGKFSEPGGGNRMPDQTVTMDEWNKAQQRIQMLESEARKTKLAEQVKGWAFDESKHTGKIVPAQIDATVDMLMGMSDEQVAKFAEFVNGLPSPISFGEVGSATATGAFGRSGGDKSDQVVKLAEQKQKEQGISFKEAFIAAATELGVK